MSDRLLKYLHSDQHYWWTVSVLPGLYALLYLYQKNFNLVNSWEQLLGLSLWFLILPSILMIALHICVKRFAKTHLSRLYFCFLLIFSAGILSLIVYMGWRWKALILLSAIVIGLSFVIGKYYKVLVLLLGLMTFFVVFQFIYFYTTTVVPQEDWVDQNIFEEVQFSKKPNVYLIQPDGYAGRDALENSAYHFDNSKFYQAMKNLGFQFNPAFRSNYPSTLSSNTSLFTGQHHYFNKGNIAGELYNARDIIIGQNPVLETFSKNGYETNFISETTYFYTSFAESAYDYSNLDQVEIPYFPFFRADLDYIQDFKSQINTDYTNTKPQFFFVQVLKPGHIATLERGTLGINQERDAYIERLKTMNDHLIMMVEHIKQNDPSAIIIAAADHGGFVGMEYTRQLHDGILDHNDELKQSSFNSLFMYRAPPEFEPYANEISSSISVFPNLFAFLCNTKPVVGLDESSYAYIQNKDGIKVKKYYDTNGNSVEEFLTD